MSGYFGNEPTCTRCDYPRRLHHLLGVDHDYQASNAKAPDAGQGIEGSESHPASKQGTNSAVTLPNVPTPAEAIADVSPDSGTTTTALEHVIGADTDSGQARVTLDRFDAVSQDGTIASDRWTVSFRSIGNNLPEIPAADIPVLIDRLTEMHRAWLYLDPANIS